MRAKLDNDVQNTFRVPCEKSKMVSFASSIMKKIVATAAQSRFLVKLLCYCYWIRIKCLLFT